MSILPEIILHRALIEGFREVRKDPRMLDTLFKNLDQRSLQSIKDTVVNKPINFTVNFPREDFTVNTIALVLKNERESQVFVGDLMGATPNYGLPDPDLAISTLGGHGASTTEMSGLPEKLFGAVPVSHVESSTTSGVTTVYWDARYQEDAQQAIDFWKGTWPSSNLYVVNGSGAGQIYPILAIDKTGVDIQGVFDPQLDSSTVVDIRRASDTGLSFGEPSRVYRADVNSYNRIGSNYDVTYQFHVIAGHQEEALYLYSVLKALLIAQKPFLHAQGFEAIKLSGSDFSARTEYAPIEVFSRILILQFTYPFYFIEEVETFNAIRLRLYARDVNTPIRETSPTLLDITLGSDNA